MSSVAAELATTPQSKGKQIVAYVLKSDSGKVFIDLRSNDDDPKEHWIVVDHPVKSRKVSDVCNASDDPLPNAVEVAPSLEEPPVRVEHHLQEMKRLKAEQEKKAREDAVQLKAHKKLLAFDASQSLPQQLPKEIAAILAEFAQPPQLTSDAIAVEVGTDYPWPR